MKRRVIQFGYIFLILLILVAGYQVMQEVKISGEFTIDDLKPAEFTDDNYFYMLFALLEPPEVDIESQEIKDKYRHLFYTAKSNHKYRTALTQEVRKNEKYWKFKTSDEVILFRKQLSLINQMEEVEKWIGYSKNIFKRYQVPLDRYENLVYKEHVIDCLRLNYKYNRTSEFIWWYIPRLYLGRCLLEIFESGDYIPGLKKIIQVLKFDLDVNKSIRDERTSSLWLANVAIEFFNNIVIQKDCPKTALKLIIDEIPDLDIEDVNQINSEIFSYLVFKERLLKSKFNNQIFHPKKKILYLRSFITKTIIKGREKLPYQNRLFLDHLKEEGKNLKKIIDNRPLLGDFIHPYYIEKSMILRPFRLMVRNDLLKIITEYKMRFDSGMSDEENFKKLKIYKKYLDPFTGENYRINIEKGYIYSIGANAIDDKDDYNYVYHKDIIMKFK